jgi:hypothetical protein
LNIEYTFVFECKKIIKINMDTSDPDLDYNIAFEEAREQLVDDYISIGDWDLMSGGYWRLND